MANFLGKLFSSKNDRELKRLSKIVEEINSLELYYEGVKNLSEETDQLKRDLIDQNSEIDSLLPAAFALVREASKRTKGMRHFDEQLIGGIALHEGKIAEMRTGEGKTLVATLPAYLNALTGDGVHVVTVNDYLARRDANWMAPIYEILGMSVGVVQSAQDPQEKRDAYQADITYGTNNEFGFDYLRSNMVFDLEDRLQRDLNFAIIDEVDSILIDEARTPLIISGQSEDSTKLYKVFDQLAPKLEQQAFDDQPRIFGEEEPAPTGDFMVDEKNRQVELTELGHEKVEQELTALGLLDDGDSLYSANNLNLLHHVHVAIKANFLFKRDVDYMITNREVVIVDEHTGRAMPGRRWSDGIHQALEAKENVPIQNESQTLASTTFQNYFRMYTKLSGMTGTADTEAFEFKQIYGLDVLVIPTHKPMIRDDQNDLIYGSLAGKYKAIAKDIVERVGKGQPVLVGTASIESSEILSGELKKQSIEHSILNAKQHEREADIIADAGRPGVVTIATNMAGRGTDIVLGGNIEAELRRKGEIGDQEQKELEDAWALRQQEVLDAGGLHIIGTERHESRRIDNQLRGRAGRQGDPGSSRFYLSFEDNLLRLFGSPKLREMMVSNIEGDDAIEARIISRSIENAQRKVEGHNFDIRKNLLDYDDVSNDQRQVIYQQRMELMSSNDISETIEGMREEVLLDLFHGFIPPDSVEEQWDVEGLERAIFSEFGQKIPVEGWLAEDERLGADTLPERILAELKLQYQTKENVWKENGIDMRLVEKQIMLQLLDQRWKEHLATMDQLRQGIHLRAYAQKQPKQEYKRESFELFQDLLYNIKSDVIGTLSKMQIDNSAELEKSEKRMREQANKDVNYSRSEEEAFGRQGQTDTQSEVETFVRQERKVGRNEPCPCGSGKKYKQCCGRKA